MEKRLLSRNQGRVDDNIDTIRKRFKVFVDSSLPVIEYYEIRGKVRKVDAARPIDEVFDSIKPLFMPFVQDDLLTLSENLLHAIDNGDYTTYKRLCDTEVTSFVPEAQGHLVQGLDFQRFYFDLVLETKKLAVACPSVQSIISSPTVSVLSDDVGLVTYTRLQQKLGSPSEGMVVAYNETRLWKRVKSTEGEWEWKNVHLHQSKTPSS
ncbi:hypothetical protein O6H91_Y308400 [Diphasiastrum complanatum]|nr:hypothetical protein O6H91_Y308400 [Diphasiastrum complanatum]